MKKVLLIIAPMGFGPAAKGLYIANKLSTYTELSKKFAHLTEEDLQILQDDVDYEFCMLGGLSVLDGECQLPVSAED